MPTASSEREVQGAAGCPKPILLPAAGFTSQRVLISTVNPTVTSVTTKEQDMQAPRLLQERGRVEIVQRGGQLILQAANRDPIPGTPLYEPLSLT